MILPCSFDYCIILKEKNRVRNAVVETFSRRWDIFKFFKVGISYLAKRSISAIPTYVQKLIGVNTSQISKRKSI